MKFYKIALDEHHDIECSECGVIINTADAYVDEEERVYCGTCYEIDSGCNQFVDSCVDWNR